MTLKEDLKSPDKVTESLRKGFVWTTQHTQLMIVAVLAFVVLGGGYSAFNYFGDKKEQGYQELYYKYEKQYLEKKAQYEQAAAPEAQKKTAEANKPKTTPASGDLQKDYGDVLTGFEEVIKTAPQSKAAKMAALTAANIFLEYKKEADAETVLKKVPSDKDDLLSYLVLNQLGSAAANKNDCNQAIGYWEKILARKGAEFMANTVKLQMGLCYESMKNPSKAQELYTQVKNSSEEGKDSVTAKTAEKYLRLLRL